MTPYSQLPEEQKEKMRQAHKRWAANHPRTTYYAEYDANRSVASKLRRSSKDRARQESIPHTLSIEDIIVPEICPICSVKMAVAANKGGNSTSFTLDKVKPELGYVPGNIAVICKLCNSTKGNGSAELHRNIADYIDSFS